MKSTIDVLCRSMSFQQLRCFVLHLYNNIHDRDKNKTYFALTNPNDDNTSRMVYTSILSPLQYKCIMKISYTYDDIISVLRMIYEYDPSFCIKVPCSWGLRYISSHKTCIRCGNDFWNVSENRCFHGYVCQQCTCQLSQIRFCARTYYICDVNGRHCLSHTMKLLSPTYRWYFNDCDSTSCRYKICGSRKNCVICGIRMCPHGPMFCYITKRQKWMCYKCFNVARKNFSKRVR